PSRVCLRHTVHPHAVTPRLHDALPISDAEDSHQGVEAIAERQGAGDRLNWQGIAGKSGQVVIANGIGNGLLLTGELRVVGAGNADRKSTRLNSSHVKISYAVFCLKKKK